MADLNDVDATGSPCSGEARVLGQTRCRAAQAASCDSCGVKDVSVCSALEAVELEAFNALSEKVIFRSKETLFLQGDDARAVYNVTCGTLRLYKLLPDGRRQIVGFLLPGDFVGLSLSERYGFSADAIDQVSACRFDRGDFIDFVDRNPHLLRRLHQAATHELTLAQDHMVLLGRRAAEEKVAAFLLAMRGRLRRLGGSAVTIPLAMTRQDLADHLGLTLETVSRVVSKLAREKTILVVPDGLRIMDAGRLEQIGAS
ncbi:Crp/Fnr family transcriptional regulator [Hansschlegelia zhihuaiae]|uniref:Cyclic nucleotide-binding domain-containing protein n=1 Tax=Hansschlegelia zhihuaiae TaxID=405005 RepID=A0A4Q0MJP2_9HYPH|nr:cyclic nucleotide-binding domain-containing protein [Hansschlegelia zhihuaiae]RXF73186.1 cyclic nucleotide-binding domain-containing protein [Hansschlegelia zhihuaiae]